MSDHISNAKLHELGVKQCPGCLQSRATRTRTSDSIFAETWGEGYLAGLADMQNGRERANPYRSQP